MLKESGQPIGVDTEIRIMHVSDGEEVWLWR
jgi:hypothetical protein